MKDGSEERAPLPSSAAIPVDTNTIWYSLGGVLAISIALEIVTGFFLALRYTPDAGKAFGTTARLLDCTSRSCRSCCSA